MNIFFVDYENNQKECTKNYKKVKTEDIVYIYYTDNSNFMDMNMFEYFDNNGIKYNVFHITDNEKEAIDNRIKFDIFDLLKRKRNHDYNIYVISKDNGYKSLKNILAENFGFERYYCAVDFSCKENTEKAAESKAEPVKKPAEATAKESKKSDILTAEVSEYLNSHKNEKFSTAEIHNYLQKKHKNETPKYTLKKYGFKTMKELLKTVDGIKNKNDKYYCA